MGGRYFPVTMLGGKIYADGFGERGPWDTGRLAFQDEATVEVLVARVAHRKVVTAEELLAVLQETQKGLPPSGFGLVRGWKGLPVDCGRSKKALLLLLLASNVYVDEVRRCPWVHGISSRRLIAAFPFLLLLPKITQPSWRSLALAGLFHFRLLAHSEHYKVVSQATGALRPGVHPESLLTRIAGDASTGCGEVDGHETPSSRLSTSQV